MSPLAYLCRGDILFSLKIRYSFIIFAVISILLLDLEVIFYALFCMSVHEASHMISAKLLGHDIKSLSLSAQGLTIDLDQKPSGYKNIIIILSGPLINLLCSSVYMLITHDTSSLFVAFNQSFGFFNLIPLKFLDGGRLLEELLDLCFPSRISERICFIVNAVLLCVMWCVSIYCFLFESSHSSSMFICIFTLINLCLDDTL